MTSPESFFHATSSFSISLMALVVRPVTSSWEAPSRLAYKRRFLRSFLSALPLSMRLKSELSCLRRIIITRNPNPITIENDTINA